MTEKYYKFNDDLVLVEDTRPKEEIEAEIRREQQHEAEKAYEYFMGKLYNNDRSIF